MKQYGEAFNLVQVQVCFRKGSADKSFTNEKHEKTQIENDPFSFNDPTAPLKVGVVAGDPDGIIL